MADIEKVIKGLEECSKADFQPCVDRICPYAPDINNFCYCRINLMEDALELLKEKNSAFETVSEIYKIAHKFMMDNACCGQ